MQVPEAEPRDLGFAPSLDGASIVIQHSDHSGAVVTTTLPYSHPGRQQLCPQPRLGQEEADAVKQGVPAPQPLSSSPACLMLLWDEGALGVGGEERVSSCCPQDQPWDQALGGGRVVLWPCSVMAVSGGCSPSHPAAHHRTWRLGSSLAATAGWWLDSLAC